MDDALLFVGRNVIFLEFFSFLFMNLEPFGEIDVNDLEEFYEGTISFKGNEVDVDLNFLESESIGESVLDGVKRFLGDINTFIDQSFVKISEDFGVPDGPTQFYLNHHLEEFSSDEVMEVFGAHEVSKDVFMSSLHIERIGFYPEESEAFAVFDIQLSAEHTDYLLSVSFDKSGGFSGISFES